MNCATVRSLRALKYSKAAASQLYSLTKLLLVDMQPTLAYCLEERTQETVMHSVTHVPVTDSLTIMRALLLGTPMPSAS